MTSTLMRLIATLAVMIVIAVSAHGRAELLAQDKTSGSAVETASVKPTMGGLRRAPRSTPSGHFTATDMPLVALVAFAYAAPGDALGRDRIIGGPSWVGSERFDVAAKAPDGTPEGRVRLMLRSLLAERFKLTTHVETREGDVYQLVLDRRDGRLGPKMTRSSVDCASVIPSLCDTKRLPRLQPEPTVIYTGRGVPMESLVSILRVEAGRPVVDRTGLNGTFDFELNVLMDIPGAMRRARARATAQAQAPANEPGVRAAPEPEGLPPIFRAVQSQLGLKLEPRRGPVEHLVIDSVERPGPN